LHHACFAALCHTNESCVLTHILLLLPPADKRAAQNKLDTDFGWFADPIHFGDYPEHVRAG
jgi:hypothetical protein